MREPASRAGQSPATDAAQLSKHEDKTSHGTPSRPLATVFIATVLYTNRILLRLILNKQNEK
jgi:hypothetical protein